MSWRVLPESPPEADPQTDLARAVEAQVGTLLANRTAPSVEVLNQEASSLASRIDTDWTERHQAVRGAYDLNRRACLDESTASSAPKPTGSGTRSACDARRKACHDAEAGLAAWRDTVFDLPVLATVAAWQDEFPDSSTMALRIVQTAQKEAVARFQSRLSTLVADVLGNDVDPAAGPLFVMIPMRFTVGLDTPREASGRGRVAVTIEYRGRPGPGLADALAKPYVAGLAWKDGIVRGDRRAYFLVLDDRQVPKAVPFKSGDKFRRVRKGGVSGWQVPSRLELEAFGTLWQRKGTPWAGRVPMDPSSSAWYWTSEKEDIENPLEDHQFVIRFSGGSASTSDRSVSDEALLVLAARVGRAASSCGGD